MLQNVVHRSIGGKFGPDPLRTLKTGIALLAVDGTLGVLELLDLAPDSAARNRGSAPFACRAVDRIRGLERRHGDSTRNHSL